MGLEIGIALALACAFTTNLGFLLKHRGAGEAPAVDIRTPLASGKGLFKSRSFAIGFAVGVVALGLHIGALALAPISIVQSVISAGLVLLAVLAERMFGYRVGGRQWAGIALAALGMTLLALTVPKISGTHSAFSLSALIAFESVALVVGALLVMGTQIGARTEHHGILLGLSAGIMIGISDIAIKAMLGILDGDGFLAALFSPWMALTLTMAFTAFYAVGRGLQVGEAVPVVAMISISANVLQVIGGLVVFGDPLPAGTLPIIVQVIGFALICAAAALMPAPMRAAAPQSA